MKASDKLHKINLLLLSVYVAGCSTQSFNKKIETADLDLLKEESFMRYNTNRLDKTESSEKHFISKALISCHQKKYTKGFNLLEDEMHTNKTNPFYWNALGTCYSLSKDYTKAQFFYDLGIEALTSMKNQDKAIAESMISNNTGLIHLQFNRYTEAYESFKRSSELLPSAMTPQFNMAQLHIEFNENDKALDILKKLEARNPNDIDLLYSLALVHYRKNDLNKSFEAIQRVKPDYLNRPDIVGLYAYNLMKKNRLAEAKNIIEKRLYADSYDQRNKILHEEINQRIKEQSLTEKQN